MSLIAWARKIMPTDAEPADANIDGWQIAITDHQHHGLKLFSDSQQTQKMQHAIYRGIINEINPQGIFIKADKQAFFMRNRKNSYHIGQKLLLQLDKIHPTIDADKLPRATPNIRLENYYWRYDSTQTAISLADGADNYQSLMASLMAWAQKNDAQDDGDKYPHHLKAGLHLKKTGHGIAFETLLPAAEKLLLDYHRLQQNDTIGRLSAEQSLINHSLKFPITAWHVPNKHLALLVNTQLAAAGLQMPVHLRDDCDEIIATLADEQDSSHHAGGLLIFNHFPSGWLVDVNSQQHIHTASSHGQNHQQFALQINLLAAQELCRLIYLKEIYGIIIVDFIGMRAKNNRQKLLQHLHRTAQKCATLLDAKPFIIHGFTRAGMLEIERPTDYR